MQARDKFLEKIKFIFFIILIFFQNNNSYGDDIRQDLINYNSQIVNSSSSFIQSDDSSVQEGEVYIGQERIKVEYKKPNRISIVLTKNKGMYINHELKEVQFFNTKKSFVRVFFEILKDKSFIEKADIKSEKNNVFIKKNYFIDDTNYNVEVIYQNNPIKIRKIKIIHDELGFNLGFFDFKYDLLFEKGFFSLISPYPN